MAFPYWLTVNPTQGTGPGSSTVRVLSNTGRSRSYTMTVSGTVDGETVTSTAKVSQEGTYKAVDSVVVNAGGATINTTQSTNGDGSKSYAIGDSDWKANSVFSVRFTSNAGACKISLIPSSTAVSFSTSTDNTISYTDDTGATTSTSLKISSSTTSIDTRTILPTGFDPGINGTYTISFGISPNYNYKNPTTKDIFCGVGIYTLEEYDSVTIPTLAAQVGKVYQGTTGITPSFPGGGSELSVGTSGATSTLTIECADTSTWTIV